MQGYFKYNKVGVAKASAQIILTKFNGTNADTVAMGLYVFDTTSSYIQFQVDINALSFQMPDSIKIIIKNAEYGQPCQGSDVVCNLLYIDDLHLSNIPLNINSIKTNEHSIKIYPNPVNSSKDIYISIAESIENGNIKIVNTAGQIVLQKQINSISGNTITLSDSTLPAGVYFLTIETLGSRTTEKLIILQ